MKPLYLLMGILLMSCQNDSMVVNDDYVIVEFAARLEEHNLAEKPQLHTINEVKGAANAQSKRSRF